jgi:hypothetical protein
MRQCDSAMTTIRRCDNDDVDSVIMRWRKYDIAIILSHCGYRTVALLPSHFRPFVIALSHCRHRTIILSPSRYRIVDCHLPVDNYKLLTNKLTVNNMGKKFTFVNRIFSSCFKYLFLSFFFFFVYWKRVYKIIN